MKFTDKAIEIFNKSINDYHINDNVDAIMQNPYKDGSLEALLYNKNWIDTVQWHLEDIIREPSIDSQEALKIKRRIDFSNQERTDMVEYIDSYFLDKYKSIKPKNTARIYTETLAWAIDRLSILCLKIYHMSVEVNRETATKEHKDNCRKKLDILLNQKEDMSISIEQYIESVENGDCYIKVYKQMKMYNDPSLNPVLYKK